MPDTKARTRSLMAGVPVMTTQRIHGGIDLLAVTEFKDALVSLIVRAVRSTKTDVLGYAIQDNHTHFILRQDFDGADLKRGISAFQRNVFAPFARLVNARGRGRGHVVERRYHSTNLCSVGDLVRAMGYVHGQREHHCVSAHAARDWRSSWSAVVDRVPDGVVSCLPVLFGDGMSEEEMAERVGAMLTAIAERACAAERAIETDQKPQGEELKSTAKRRRNAASQARELAAEVNRATAEAWRKATTSVLHEYRVDGLRPAVSLPTAVALHQNVLHLRRAEAHARYRTPPEVRLTPLLKNRRVVAFEATRSSGETVRISATPRLPPPS